MGEKTKNWCCFDGVELDFRDKDHEFDGRWRFDIAFYLAGGASTEHRNKRRSTTAGSHFTTIGVEVHPLDRSPLGIMH
ncbi:hypothetical protein MKW98_003952 [Papaver atlanticum]|uniref:Uncharacterized protein n=1 Tax=Papaver atlanticum TaxID=357466 RepID=A0AAD4SPD7_9MAGN|nr:hypothetical protein MKW98_003952 [Papaver atlanticum]